MRFAHLSDTHLGFQKIGSLRNVEQEVFEKALNMCIEKRVNFVLIAGDMFHMNVPDMQVQRHAFAQFRKMYEAGIPVYVVYGSHDFSPMLDSVIDLLVETRYITKVASSKESDGKIGLNFFTDPGTGAKICGLSGQKVGKDIEYYEKLDRKQLEAEPGFKIFLFHGSITEMRDGLDAGDHMPVSMLPRGFAYYAGGHLHNNKEESFDGYPHVVYPGTLFAGHYPDLAANAKGKKRGFYVVEFEDRVTDTSFVEVENVLYESIKINAKGSNPSLVNDELKKWSQGIDPSEKIIVITMHGEMTDGKTTEVDVASISEELSNRGAKSIEINKKRLTSMEYIITSAKGENRAEIENNIFAENIGQLRFKEESLIGDSGVNLAKELLAKIGQPKLKNETNDTYSTRMSQDGLDALELETDDS